MDYSEEKYAEFLRGKLCIIDRRCSGDVIAHHLRTSWNSGIGMKPSDLFSVPMCHFHHHELHLMGARTFQNRHGVDLWEILESLHTECEKRYGLQLDVQVAGQR